MQQHLTLEDLTPETLLQLVLDEGYTAHIDDTRAVLFSGEVVLLDPCLDQRTLHLRIPFWFKARHLDALKFCNRINRKSVMIRASLAPERDAQRDWCVVIDREIPLLPGQTIAREDLLVLLRRFIEFGNEDILEFDTAGLLD